MKPGAWRRRRRNAASFRFFLNESDERLQRGRRAAPTRMVEKEPRHGRPPILKNRHEPPRCDVVRDIVAQQVGEPKSIEHGLDRQIDIVDNEAAAHSSMNARRFLEKSQAKMAPLGRRLRMQSWSRRSRGDFGAACARRQSGEPTTRKRASSITRIAIMSRSTCSPKRIPASKPSFTMSPGILMTATSSLDVGICAHESSQHRTDHEGRHRRLHRKAQKAARCCAPIDGLAGRRAQFIESRTNSREKAGTSLRERNAPRGAVEQPHAKPFLQRAKILTQGGPSDAEHRRGLGETLMLGDGREGRHLGKLGLAHCSATSSSPFK
jgi:hypothetical protein